MRFVEQSDGAGWAAKACVQLPVPNCTSCTFAGPELATLVVTTARRKDANPEHAGSGGVWKVEGLGVRGVTEFRFKEGHIACD